MSVRVIGGFIEINYERFAQVLPGKDERTLREEILEINEEDLAEKCDEAYQEGYERGVEDGESKVHEFNDEIDAALDKLFDEGLISKKVHDLLCERLPTP